MNRTISLWLDASSVAVFLALMSWRLTGVSIHEWAASALLAALVVHLIIHWHWVETRIVRFKSSRTRTRVNVALNLALFLSMGIALASGYAISKVMFANSLSAGAYIRWHSVHEISSNVTIFILGLHVAVNWDIIWNGIRRVFSRRRRFAVSPLSTKSRNRSLFSRPVLRPLAMIVVASVLVAGLAKGLYSLTPQEEVLYRRPGGRMEAGPPPADIGKLRNGDDRPMPGRGGPKVVLMFILLSGAAFAGRKILRLSL
ncbi:MAG: DUF4405 domain-containing protein [Chthoniobacterales bacterium]